MAKLFYAIIIFFLICATESDQDVCVQKNSCLCEFSEYSKIDLSKSTQNGQEPLKKQDFLEDMSTAGTFYFHGCQDGEFNLTAHGIPKKPNSTVDTISGSLIFQSTYGNTTNATILGTKDQIKFNPVKDSDSGYEINFVDAKGNVTASIRLICDNFNQPLIKFLKNDTNVQKLALASPHACIVTHHPGMSTGSVLVIIFFIAISVYFACGCLILYFMRGARGLEMVPNIDFWRELPGLVKDGIIFLFSGCRPNSVITPETYDRI